MLLIDADLPVSTPSERNFRWCRLRVGMLINSDALEIKGRGGKGFGGVKMYRYKQELKYGKQVDFLLFPSRMHSGLR